MLSVQAVTCRDLAGRPYEITLRLARDSVPFAAVGQRCGHQLAELAERISAARLDPEQAAAWPDPDDRFPGAGGGPDPFGLPGDHEYFTLRSKDRSDLPGTGELRCVLRSTAVWLGECAGTVYPGEPAHRHGLSQGPHGPASQHTAPQHGRPVQPSGPRAMPGQRIWPARRPAGAAGRWHLTRRAFIEAWGDGGIGVRAVLTSAELAEFLDTVLTEETPASAPTPVPAASSPAGGMPAAGRAVHGVPAGNLANQA